MNIALGTKKISYCLGLFAFITIYTHANDDWVQEEIQWWEQQQESFQQDFNQITEKSKLKNTSEFKLTEKYWKTIKPYFFQNDTYVGYCVLDAYDTKLPLIITKVRNKNTYSIAVDVNVYIDNSEDTNDLKLCHTDDLLNAYTWADSQSVHYTSSSCIYEMYFKLCPLDQYPKTNIPGILIPLKTAVRKNNFTKELNQKLKDGMESIWKNADNESIWHEAHKDVEPEILQPSTTDEIKSWQTWFKETLSALKEVKFDFKKQVIDPTCLDEDLKFIFEKHFGETKITKEIETQFDQKLIKLSETIDQMKDQEKALRAEIETLQNHISELQSEKAPENLIQENLEQPNYITKDGRKIGKLKHVEGDNILDSIKQYQDDSKNEKSNLSEESIQKMQEESRQRMLTKAQENIESAKRAETERAKGIQQFGSTASNMTAEMNQLFTHSKENEEFDPKAALKRIKDKDIPKDEPEKSQPQNKPGKLELDNGFKRNMESIFGGLNNSDLNTKPQKENLNTPGKLKIDSAFEEKLRNDLGTERKQQETTTFNESFSFNIPPAPTLNLNKKLIPNAPTPPPLNLNSTKTEQPKQQEFYIPPAPELKLDTPSIKTKTMDNQQQSLEQIMKKRQEMFNQR